MASGTRWRERAQPPPQRARVSWQTATPAIMSATPRAITTSRRLRREQAVAVAEDEKGTDSQPKRDSKAAQSHLSSYVKAKPGRESPM